MQKQFMLEKNIQNFCSNC